MIGWRHRAQESDTDQRTERGLKAEGYLVKPFELRELLAQVQHLIGAA